MKKNTQKLNQYLQNTPANIRPILTYATPTWSTGRNAKLKKIQPTENKYLRIIFYKKKHCSNDELLRNVGITHTILRKEKEKRKHDKHKIYRLRNKTANTQKEK